MRYPALETVKTILNIIAGIEVVLAVLGFFIQLRAGFFIALGVLISLIITAVMTFAAAQMIAVVLDIEANTRNTAEALRGRPAGQ
jgi:tetrahydromethanopterin S-methyltransferase subunit B